MPGPDRPEAPTDRRTTGGFAFVGREAELARLLAAAQDGPAVVLVEGEAGSGKSRLLREAVPGLEAVGLAVLRGGCHPLREPPAFGAVLEALRDAPQLLPADTRFGQVTAPLAGYLPGAVGDPAGQLAAGQRPAGVGTHRQQLMRAVHELLRLLGPVALLVEDLQWADDDTRELLVLLARNPPAQLRLVLSYRAGELPGHGNVLGVPYRRPVGVGGTEIALAALTEPQVRDLAVSVLGPAATGALVRQLYECSGGLPLAVEEVLGELTVHQVPGRPRASDRAPRAVRELVAERTARLAPSAAAVVRAAAVLGLPADEDLLGAVARLPEGETDPALTAALAVGLLMETDPGRYGFRHVLARRAAYEAIPAPQRVRLHARAAEVLSGHGAPALLRTAHHVRRTGDVAAWITTAGAAAHRAVESGDDGAAAVLLRDLLAEPTLSKADRTAHALTLARISQYRAGTADGAELLRRLAADRARPAGVRGELRLGLCRARALGPGDPAALLAELEQTAADLVDRPGPAAVALAELAAVGVLRGPGSRERAVADLARAAAAAARCEDELARTVVLVGRVAVAEAFGDPGGPGLVARLRGTGLRLPGHGTERSPDRRIERERARGLHLAAVGAWARGRDDRARARQQEAVAAAGRSGHQLVQLAGLALELQLDLEAGRWDGLDGRIEALLPRLDGHGGLRLEALAVRAALDTARGRWAAARRALPPRGGRSEPPDGVPRRIAAALLGRLELLEGADTAAWAAVRPTVEASRRNGQWSWATGLLPVAVRAALACGLREEAEGIVADAARGVEGLDTPGVDAELVLARGLLGAADDPRAAVTLLVEAGARYGAIGREYQRALAAEETAAVLLGLGRAADADTAVRRALEVLTRLGATADAARCRRMLRASGRPAAVPRARRGEGGHLSPREREVALLVADGAGNRQIAGALALSPRTAEHHVAKVLGKLGVTRAELRSGELPEIERKAADSLPALPPHA
ncbi:AAA family ATPase [Kitasatospora sp. NPDC001664]